MGQQMVVLEVAKIEARHGQTLRDRRLHEVRQRERPSLAHVLLVGREDHAPLLADDDQDAPHRKRLRQSIRNLFAVVATGERMASEALERDHRNQTLTFDALQERIELSA